MLMLKIKNHSFLPGIGKPSLQFWVGAGSESQRLVSRSLQDKLVIYVSETHIYGNRNCSWHKAGSQHQNKSSPRYHTEEKL